MPLEPADLKQLRAAQRFVERGQFLEANDELERIDPWCRHVPEVLAGRLDIYQALEKWDAMEPVARRLVNYDPNDVRWTVLWAMATRQSDGLAAAQVILLEAVERLPTVSISHYTLACYECQLGQIEVAKARLAHAFKLDPSWRAAAPDDEDLRPIWDSL